MEINVIYSSDLHLNILPKWANKGNALRWLLQHLNIFADHAIVAGDSGNDTAMFQIEGINGIVVANAHPELLRDIKPVCRTFRPRRMMKALWMGYYTMVHNYRTSLYTKILPETNRLI